MKKTFYKKGQQVDAMSVAGADMWQYEKYGVCGDLFITGNKAEIPSVYSKNQRQGNFKKWLLEIEQEFIEIQFNNLINTGLEKYLLMNGYKKNKTRNLIKQK